MKGFDLILTLRDDCVFSERSATEGGHRGLDYIPGAALLGAAAARLYAGLPATDTFTLFHSGQVQYGNGLPLGIGDERSWPVPLCWHRVKGDKVVEGRRVGAGHRAKAIDEPARLVTGSRAPASAACAAGGRDLPAPLARERRSATTSRF